MSATFSVINYERFQHYKDRNPPWIKFHNSTLDDYALAALPDACKAHLFAIWLLASRHNNIIPADATWVARRINATTKVDLAALADAGFIEFNQSCSDALAERKQSDDRETETEGETEGETEKNILIKTPDRFDEFWAAYPRKIGKGAARKSFQLATKKAPAEEIIAAAVRFAILRRGKDTDFTPHPSTWLIQGRWGDETHPTDGASLSRRFGL